MKVLKVILLAVVAVIAVSLVAFLIKKDYEASATVKIEAPAKMVSEYVSELKNWPNWMPWQEKDPEMKNTYGDKTQGEGAWYKWEGNKEVGTGKLTIKKYEPATLMNTYLEFEEPFETTSEGYWVFDENEDGTTNVTWGNKGKIPILMTLFYDFENMMSKEFENGLKNLNRELNKIQEAQKPKFTFEVEEIKGFPYFYIHKTHKISELTGDMFNEHFKQIMNGLGGPEKVEEKIIHPPMARYLVWDEENDNVELEYAIASTVNARPKAPIKKGQMDDHLAVTASITGPGEASGQIHEAVYGWVEQNGYEIIGNPWETYDNWKVENGKTIMTTKVFYPVKKKGE